MRRLAFVLCAWAGLAVCAAMPAVAQTVTLRSGNHAGFVRLVFDIPPGTPWQLGRLGAGYALDLGTGYDYDLTGAFDRIPRDRLRDLGTGAPEGRLVLDLACPCHATAFLFRPDKLVVDVVDGPPPDGSPWEEEVADAAPPAPPPTPAPAELPLLAGLPRSALLFTPPGPEGVATARAPEAEAAAPAESAPLLDDLAADMARAVAAGLLDAPGLPEAGGGGDVPADPAAALAPLAEAGADRPGVSFIAADAAGRTDPGARALGRYGQPCLPESDFDLAAWGPSGEFSRDIGTLRGRVITAAGEPDPEAITALAKAYLHYGFGAEARRTLALAGQDSTGLRLIGHLADLIDGRPVAPGVLADQAGCLTPAALWSALADGTIEGRTAAERTAIEAAFRVLPPGPRRAVAPRLAALFLAAGLTESAAAMLARLPAEAAGSDDAVAVESDIVRDASSAAAARETLLAAIRDGSRASAGTMIRLVDATLAAGLPVEPWMIETLSALRFEYGESPVAGPLAVAEIRAMTAGGRLAEAAALLADPDPALAAAEQAPLVADLARAYAASATDADFLAFAFDGPLAIPPGAPANAMAERLIALGFPDVALDLLAPPAEGEAMGERRRLRATALQALGQEEEAALLLAGIAAEAGAAPPDAAAAWRAGNWDAISAAEDPLLTEVAAAVLDTGGDPVADGSLAAREALIGAAEETRRLAEDLLDRFPAPAPPAVDAQP